MKRQHGLSLLEIDIALLLTAVMVFSLYSATASSIRLSQKDSLYTEATNLCQRQLEDVVLSAKSADGFYLVAPSGPSFLGDYNGDTHRFVAVQSVQALTTRLKKVTVQVYLSQSTTTPQPAATPLVQFSTVVGTL